MHGYGEFPDRLASRLVALMSLVLGAALFGFHHAPGITVPPRMAGLTALASLGMDVTQALVGPAMIGALAVVLWRRDSHDWMSVAIVAISWGVGVIPLAGATLDRAVLPILVAGDAAIALAAATLLLRARTLRQPRASRWLEPVILALLVVAGTWAMPAVLRPLNFGSDLAETAAAALFWALSLTLVLLPVLIAIEQLTTTELRPALDPRAGLAIPLLATALAGLWSYAGGHRREAVVLAVLTVVLLGLYAVLLIALPRQRWLGLAGSIVVDSPPEVVFEQLASLAWMERPRPAGAEGDPPSTVAVGTHLLARLDGTEAEFVVTELEPPRMVSIEAVRPDGATEAPTAHLLKLEFELHADGDMTRAEWGALLSVPLTWACNPLTVRRLRRGACLGMETHFADQGLLVVAS